MSKNGYIAIVGRIKEMIIRGGENIYPREIEDVLRGHSSIQEAQVNKISKMMHTFVSVFLS